MTPSQALEALAWNLDLRAALSREATQAILMLPYRFARLDRRKFLIREGEPVARCYLLLSGFAGRHKSTGDGGRQMLAIDIPGNIVGLHNILIKRASYNVQVLRDARVAIVAASAVLALTIDYPDIARAMWADTMADGSVLSERLLNIGRRDARQRIAHLVCELAVRQEAAGLGNGPEYEWPVTQEELADATGLTSVHVNRVLQRLRSDGVLRIGSRQVMIMDWERLKAIADFSPAYLHLNMQAQAVVRADACQIWGVSHHAPLREPLAG